MEKTIAGPWVSTHLPSQSGHSSTDGVASCSAMSVFPVPPSPFRMPGSPQGICKLVIHRRGSGSFPFHCEASKVSNGSMVSGFSPIVPSGPCWMTLALVFGCALAFAAAGSSVPASAVLVVLACASSALEVSWRSPPPLTSFLQSKIRNVSRHSPGIIAA